MILEQHLEIDGLEFDIKIRKAPPVDEAGGKELAKWIQVIVDVLELEAGEPFDWANTTTIQLEDKELDELISAAKNVMADVVIPSNRACRDYQASTRLKKALGPFT